MIYKAYRGDRRCPQRSAYVCARGAILRVKGALTKGRFIVINFLKGVEVNFRSYVYLVVEDEIRLVINQ